MHGMPGSSAACQESLNEPLCLWLCGVCRLRLFFCLSKACWGFALLRVEGPCSSIGIVASQGQEILAGRVFKRVV